jgi:hypothetical protein
MKHGSTTTSNVIPLKFSRARRNREQERDPVGCMRGHVFYWKRARLVRAAREVSEGVELSAPLDLREFVESLGAASVGQPLAFKGGKIVGATLGAVDIVATPEWLADCLLTVFDVSFDAFVAAIERIQHRQPAPNPRTQ